MNEVRHIQKNYCSQAMLFAISVAAIFLIIGAKPISKGLILGTLFSIINFILMAQGLPLQLNKPRGKTFLTCLGSIWMRYILLALPLIIAAKLQIFDFFATAAGILMVQFVIIAHHVGRMITFKR
jgi:hypothetical protein